MAAPSSLPTKQFLTLQNKFNNAVVILYIVSQEKHKLYYTPYIVLM